MSKEIRSEILDRLKTVPIGATITIFAKNPLTKLWGWIESHRKDIPTHSAIYVGTWQGQESIILEAVKWVEFNPIMKYLKKKNVKVVAQWYTDLTLDEKTEMYRRIVWFAGRKMFYDIAGYAGFFTRLIPVLRKIIPPSNKRNFCSELDATVYEGDKNSSYKTHREWKFIRAWSSKPTPTASAPVDGYSYMLKEKDCVTLILKDKGELLYNE